jgi:hypothetical protein
MHPYTGSRSRRFASYTRLLAASALSPSATSCAKIDASARYDAIFNFVIKKRRDFSSWVSAYQEHLGDVAGAEDLVDGGEFVGLVRREVGGEGALLRAAAAEELARGAGGHGVEGAAEAETEAAGCAVVCRCSGGGGGGEGEGGCIRLSLDLLADLIESLPAGGSPTGRVVTA